MPDPSGDQPPGVQGRAEVRFLDCLERAIALINAAADGAGDEEVTPSRIAAGIAETLGCPEAAMQEVGRHLREAADAVADGMPADFVAGCLYSAQRAFTAARR